MKSRALPPQLFALAERIAAECTQCRACQIRCAFLREHDTPKLLADRLLDKGHGRALAFECSLCGLCETHCPMHLPLSDFFLSMRRAALDAGRVSLSPYRALLNYEATGSSRLFRAFMLPPGGDTVFFPGCSFPGTNPATTAALFLHLRKCVPSLGLALDCCFNPSHDLGRQDFFERHFGELRTRFLACGVRTLLTACPNCFKVFSRYGDGLAVKTVYETLSEYPLPARPHVHGPAIMHTPCPFRGQASLQEIILGCAQESGLDVEKTRHDGSQSPCCGEGGAVGALKPENSLTWAKSTTEHAHGRIVVTTCAGCVKALSPHAHAVHLLDLLFFPAETVDNTRPRSQGMATYLHRLLFKWKAGRIRD
jgi:Fe-S oxidoreductase